MTHKSFITTVRKETEDDIEENKDDQISVGSPVKINMDKRQSGDRGRTEVLNPLIEKTPKN
jgi:hypothetical protein